MPIVSRTLVKLTNRDDIETSVKTWQIQGLDGRGKYWTHGPFNAKQTVIWSTSTGDVPPAETTRDTCWSQEMLEDVDEEEGVKFTEDGGDPGAFVREDLTLAQWRKRVAKRFWRGTLLDDRKFMVKAAIYIAGFTAVQIAGVLNISVAKAQLGIDKAIDIQDNLAAQMATVDAQAEEV